MLKFLIKKLNLNSFHTILYILGIITFSYYLLNNLKYLKIVLVLLITIFGFSKFDSIYHYKFENYFKNVDIIINLISFIISRLIIIYFVYFKEFAFFFKKI